MIKSLKNLFNKEIQEVNRRPLELNKQSLEVIDLYYNMDIILVYDILESLYYFNSKDKKEIFNYIEFKRNHWKLENNKKMIKNPYK